MKTTEHMDQKEWDSGDESSCFLLPVLIFFLVCAERLRLKSDDKFLRSLDGLTILMLFEKIAESIVILVSAGDFSFSCWEIP